MADKQEKHTTPIFVLTVFGVTVKQFRTREKAMKYKKDLEEEPFLFSDIHEWQAEDWMIEHNVIKFAEDEEK